MKLLTLSLLCSPLLLCPPQQAVHLPNILNFVFQSQNKKWQCISHSECLCMCLFAWVSLLSSHHSSVVSWSFALFCSALFCFVLMLMLMLRFNKWNWCVIKNTKTKRNPSNQLLFPCSSDSRSGSELTTWSHTNRQITSRENIKTNCSSNPKHQQQQKWQ